MSGKMSGRKGPKLVLVNSGDILKALEEEGDEETRAEDELDDAIDQINANQPNEIHEESTSESEENEESDFEPETKSTPEDTDSDEEMTKTQPNSQSSVETDTSSQELNSSQSSSSSSFSTRQRGKPLSSVWIHFEKSSHNNKIMATCKICKTGVSAQAQRLQKHYEKCTILMNRKERAAKSFSSDPKPVEPSVQYLTATKKSEMKQHLVKISATRKEEFDKMLGRFMFSSSTPFRVLSNEYFREFLKSLNPAYKLPDRRTLGGTILDEIYEEVNNKVKNDLQNRKAVILQDGWSTNQNEPVISHCLQTADKMHFLSAESSGSNAKTAEYCFNSLDQAIQKAEDNFQCKIVGAITDNNNTMLAVQRLLKEKYPEMETVGCNAHLFNLVGDHFTSKTLQEKVVLVQKYMKNHHFTLSSLKQAKGNLPILPNSTRWNSQIDCFISYKENHDKYLGIIRKTKPAASKDEKDKLAKIVTILEDPKVYNDIRVSINILSPLCVALDTAQRLGSKLADSTSSWIGLLEKLPQTITSSQYFKKHFENGVTGVSVAALLISPRYKGLEIPTHLKNLGLNWIGKKNNMFLLYTAGIGDPSSEYFYESYQQVEVMNKMDSDKWWKAASTPAVHPSMLDFVESLLTLPASTGSLERCFSSLGNIMTEKRNQLTLEKASKLCTISNSLKVTDTRRGKKRKLEN